MEKYPKEVDAFLAGVRAADQPGTEDRARIHRSLSKTLMHHGFNPPAAAPAAAPQGSRPDRAFSPGTSSSLAVRLAALALTTGALVTVCAYFASEPSSGNQAPKALPPTPAVTASERPAAERKPPAVTSVMPSAAPVHAVPEPRAAELEPQATTRAGLPVVRKYRAARPAPSPETGGLADEIALIAEARNELEGGHAELALASLARHAQRFERGALSDERRGLRALALCRLGRFAEGVAASDRFLQSSRNPMLAAQVRAACAAPVEQGGR